MFNCVSIQVLLKVIWHFFIEQLKKVAGLVKDSLAVAKAKHLANVQVLVDRKQTRVS
jgi:hypothetical protein